MPDLSIIIVSYNTRDLTAACLTSIHKHVRALDYEIIVVDNASSDDSCSYLAEQYPDVRLIANEDNMGFGPANNQGMAAAHGRYLLLINSDTELRDDAIGEMVRWADQHSEADVVGPTIQGSDGYVQRTVFRLYRLRSFLLNIVIPVSVMNQSPRLGGQWYVGEDLSRPRQVEAISGCCMLLRREVYERTGGFDPAFFMYAEEFEWAARMQKAGFVLMYNPDMTIIHHGGMSTKQAPERMYLEMSRSQVRFFAKTRGPAIGYLANLSMAARDLPRALAWLPMALLAHWQPNPWATRLRPMARRFVMHARGLVRPWWNDKNRIHPASATPAKAQTQRGHQALSEKEC